VQVGPDEAETIETLTGHFVTSAGASSAQVATALEDGYKRLLGPSMETELRNALKRRADATAIAVFADNLRNLLLAAPLGQKAILALDPGFRTGCKAVCLDKQGALLHSDTVYLHLGAEREAKEAQRILEMVKKYNIQAIAIGNGTAGRETEAVVRNLKLPGSVATVMVTT
jgi:uncharacterized protein